MRYTCKLRHYHPGVGRGSPSAFTNAAAIPPITRLLTGAPRSSRVLTGTILTRLPVLAGKADYGVGVPSRHLRLRPAGRPRLRLRCGALHEGSLPVLAETSASSAPARNCLCGHAWLSPAWQLQRQLHPPIQPRKPLSTTSHIAIFFRCRFAATVWTCKRLQWHLLGRHVSVAHQHPDGWRRQDLRRQPRCHQAQLWRCSARDGPEHGPQPAGMPHRLSRFASVVDTLRNDFEQPAGGSGSHTVSVASVRRSTCRRGRKT